MSVICSTGFRAALVGGMPFATIFERGCIEVYSGPQPASADAAVTGDLLGRITVGGQPWAPGNPANGLLFQQQGIHIQNDPAQSWVLRGLAAGMAGWFRLRGNNPADAGEASTSHYRIDGAIGMIDGPPGDHQMMVPNTIINAETAYTITAWWFYLPPL